MPRRSNLFQDVVAIIHRHMAGDAAVTESAMLTNRLTGEEREVDVLIETNVSGHKLTVAVEACATGRPADVEWVETELAKHRNLPTDKLILVSESGFTAQARKLGEAEYAVCLAPEDLAEGDAASVVVSRLRSIWPKHVEIIGTASQVLAPAYNAQWVAVTPGLFLYLDTGMKLGQLSEGLWPLVQRHWDQVERTSRLSEIVEDRDAPFVVAAKLQEPHVVVGGQPRYMCIQQEREGEPPQLHRISAIRLEGLARVRISEFPLEHRRLGEVTYAFGKGTFKGQPALLVATEDEGGATVTLRIRDEDQGDARR